MAVPAAAATATAATTTGGDADVMAEDELEDIRKTMMMKNKNPKSRKKRGGQGRGAAGNKPSQSPSPLPSNAGGGGGGDEPGKAGALNGSGNNNSNNNDAVLGSVETAEAAAAVPAVPAVPVATPSGELQAGGGGSKDEGEGKDIDRGGVKEVKTELADSDDEISLPEGVPCFEALEEAMLVRELTKDRLPGKIIRGSDGSGSTVGSRGVPEKRPFFFFPFF